MVLAGATHQSGGSDRDLGGLGLHHSRQCSPPQVSVSPSVKWEDPHSAVCLPGKERGPRREDLMPQGSWAAPPGTGVSGETG